MLAQTPPAWAAQAMAKFEEAEQGRYTSWSGDDVGGWRELATYESRIDADQFW